MLRLLMLHKRSFSILFIFANIVFVANLLRTDDLKLSINYAAQDDCKDFRSYRFETFIEKDRRVWAEMLKLLNYKYWGDSHIHKELTAYAKEVLVNFNSNVRARVIVVENEDCCFKNFILTDACAVLSKYSRDVNIFIPKHYVQGPALKKSRGFNKHLGFYNYWTNTNLLGHEDAGEALFQRAKACVARELFSVLNGSCKEFSFIPLLLFLSILVASPFVGEKMNLSKTSGFGLGALLAEPFAFNIYPSISTWFMKSFNKKKILQADAFAARLCGVGAVKDYIRSEDHSNKVFNPKHRDGLTSIIELIWLPRPSIDTRFENLESLNLPKTSS